MHSRCKTAQNASHRASYRADPTKQRTAVQARNVRLRGEFHAALDAWLDGRTCILCGETGSHMLAIRPDGTNIRDLVKTGFSANELPEILAEATAEYRSCRQPDPVWLR